MQNQKTLKHVLYSLPLSNKPLLLKIGISGVDTLGARLNLEKEMSDWDFNKIKNKLKKYGIKSCRKLKWKAEQMSKRPFFIRLCIMLFYHQMCIMMSMVVIGVVDHEIYIAKGWNYYTVFSLWDTYRTLNPLLTLIDTTRAADFIKTFIAQYEQSGLLPNVGTFGK